MQITLNLMSAFVRCRYKAFLKCTGETGIVTEYECLRQQLADEYQQKATSRLSDGFSPGEVVSNPSSVAEALTGRHRLILGAPSVSDHHSVVFPAIERRPTSARKPEYALVAFSPNNKLSRDEKSTAALLGTALSPWHGLTVPFVKIVHGPGFSATKLMLLGNDGPTYLGKDSAAVLHDLESLAAAPTPPPMYLNDHCATCEYRNRCRKEAVDRDDLSLLRGLQPKEIEAWKKRGIFTVTQLAYMFRAKTMGRRSQQPKRHSQPLQAMAIRDTKTYIRKRPDMPTQATKVFFDVESIPERDFFYLVGVLVVRDGETTSHQFWADDESQQVAIWRNFLDLLAGLGDYVLVHFGRYEKDFIREMQRRCGVAEHDPMPRLFDVHAAIRTNVFFPVYSNGLKDIGTFLGFQWQGPVRSGINSIVWRYGWEHTRKRNQKDALRDYNHEDCLAVKHIFHYLAILQKTPNGVGMNVEQADGLPGNGRAAFGTKAFAIPALEAIVKCAYFDYQQEKIYFRTDKNVRRSVRRKRQALIASKRVNRLVRCDPPRDCPKCELTSMNSRSDLSRTKVIADLSFSGGGVKRWVTAYTTSRYVCPLCRHSCYSPQYPTHGRTFGHGLATWIVHQHVAARQSFEALRDSVADLFGYVIGQTLYTKLYSDLARTLRPVETALISRLRLGPMVCADEARFKVKTCTGYVWVFSGPEIVIYRFGTSRDATVLNEVLEGFNGVLVSDFYNVYDSAKCPQQKCLVHLIRDINDDLLKTPFDEELKDIANRFTSLMPPIIGAIDRYGLTKLHLGKFKKDSDRFCRWVGDQRFTSTIALGYQKRIGKCGDRLFTFLSYDGVPWNNNLAENAVKLIASRRKFLDGLMSEDGIRDYLLFLSIYQTLRRKGGSFLRFLLSKEMDVFKFLGETD